MEHKLTGILLTGGKSTRMGEDKANTLFNGRPLAAWSQEALAPICDEIIVSSNNLDHLKFGNKIVEDAKGVKGPLAGLKAGLEASQSEINVVLACDTPYVTSDILQNMADELKEADAIVMVSSDGQIHPLIGCYRSSILSAIKDVLASDRHSMMHLLKKISYIAYLHKDDKVALNVNAKSELL